MLGKLKQAMRMWNAGNTHGEIKEVTGLSHEVEYAATQIAKWHNLTAEQVYVKIHSIKPGMTSEEIEALFDASDEVARRGQSPKGYTIAA